MAFSVDYSINLEGICERYSISYINTYSSTVLSINQLLLTCIFLRIAFISICCHFNCLNHVVLRLMLCACSLAMDIAPVIKGIFTLKNLTQLLALVIFWTNHLCIGVYFTPLLWFYAFPTVQNYSHCYYFRVTSMSGSSISHLYTMLSSHK